MIYFGVYCWKCVYGLLWYIIKVGSYVYSMMDTFVNILGPGGLVSPPVRAAAVASNFA